MNDPAGLDVTAFMNLMVVLVPFLLIMAVFSRMTVLSLEMPSGNVSHSATVSEFQLQVTVREDFIQVAERDRGELARFPYSDDQSDLSAFGTYLAELKHQNPHATHAAILLDPGVSYQSIVAVIDRVREHASDGRSKVLFPSIALGDAPMQTASMQP